MRPIGTAEKLQRRRIRAVELVDQSESPDDVAHFLGYGRSSVYTWVKQAKESLETLAARPHPGPKTRLDDAQLEQLEDESKKVAKHHGWKTELWTSDRVAVLIERLFQSTFHVEHVRKIPKTRHRWTSQKSERRARERDEEAIRH